MYFINVVVVINYYIIILTIIFVSINYCRTRAHLALITKPKYFNRVDWANQINLFADMKILVNKINNNAAS